MPDGTKIDANLAEGEKDGDFSMSILARTLFGKANIGFAEAMRNQLKGQGYVLGKGGEWESQRFYDGAMRTIKASDNIGLSLDITSQFDSSWQTMGGNVLADWVYGGAAGVANAEIGVRSSSFFAISRMGSVAMEMQKDVVYLPGTKTINWDATLSKFDAKRNLYSSAAEIGQLGVRAEDIYNARLALLKAGAYGLIANLSSPGGSENEKLKITQYHGAQGTVDYPWRVAKNGHTFHPGIDYSMDGDAVYAGVDGKILVDPIRTTSTYYANKEEYDAAKTLANPNDWESNRWHLDSLRVDDKTSAVTVDIGFQFESYWMSSGLAVVYYHMGDIPSTLLAGTLVTPAMLLGYASDYGYSTGPHLDQTYFRLASARPSLFEIVFSNSAVTPWNRTNNTWNANAYYKPDWMRLFTKYDPQKW